jgi:hypothetical protein
MNQTGVQSTGSRRQALRNRSFIRRAFYVGEGEGVNAGVAASRAQPLPAG